MERKSVEYTVTRHLITLQLFPGSIDEFYLQLGTLNLSPEFWDVDEERFEVTHDPCPFVAKGQQGYEQAIVDPHSFGELCRRRLKTQSFILITKPVECSRDYMLYVMPSDEDDEEDSEDAEAQEDDES